jgi:hypothetical protein
VTNLFVLIFYNNLNRAEEMGLCNPNHKESIRESNAIPINEM